MADSVRTQIANIYRVHKPAKLDQLDELLAEWRGNELELLADIKEKYPPVEVVSPEEARAKAQRQEEWRAQRQREDEAQAAAVAQRQAEQQRRLALHGQASGLGAATDGALEALELAARAGALPEPEPETEPEPLTASEQAQADAEADFHAQQHRHALIQQDKAERLLESLELQPRMCQFGACGSGIAVLKTSAKCEHGPSCVVSQEMSIDNMLAWSVQVGCHDDVRSLNIIIGAVPNDFVTDLDRAPSEPFWVVSSAAGAKRGTKMVQVQKGDRFAVVADMKSFRLTIHQAARSSNSIGGHGTTRLIPF